MSARVLVDERLAAPAPPASLRCETITSAEGFALLAPDWDELVRAMRRPSPFLLHGWLSEWWRHYGAGCDLAVEVAFRDRRLVGAFPLITFRRHGLRVATFFGGRQTAPADVLVAADEPDAVADALVARAVAAGHDYADLFGLDEGCRLADAAALELFERIEAPVLDLSRGWEETYHSKTSAKKRSHHRHRRRQLAALGTVEVAVARSLPELEAALEDAFRLHELRWQGRADGSGFVTPTGRRFSRAVLPALAAREAARIVTLRLDGRAIAFMWYLLLERRMFLHRIGFDPAFAQFSPGLVNTLNALELAASEGVTRVEFLGGADRYKVELADRFEPLHLAIGLPGTPVGRAVVATRALGLRLRRRAKQSPAARSLYDRATPLRRRFERPRNVLRPSGVARRAE